MLKHHYVDLTRVQEREMNWRVSSWEGGNTPVSVMLDALLQQLLAGVFLKKCYQPVGVQILQRRLFLL